MKLIVPDSQRFGFLKPLLWINLLSIGSLIVFWTLGLLEIKPAQATLSDSELANQQDIGGEKSSDDFTLSLNQAKPSHQRVFELSQRPDTSPVYTHRVGNVSGLDASPSMNLNPTPSVIAFEANAKAGKKETLDQTAPARHDEQQSQENSPAPIDIEEAESSTYLRTIPSPIPNLPIQASISTQSGLSELALNSSHQTLNIQEEFLTPKLSSNQNCQDKTTCNPTLALETSVRFRDNFDLKVAQLPTLLQNSSPLPVPTNTIPLGSTGSNSGSGQLPAFPSIISPTPQPQGANPYNQTWGQPSSFNQTPNVIPMSGTGAAMGINSYNPTWGQSLSVTQTPNVIPMPGTGAAMGINSYNPTWGQSSSFAPTPNFIPASTLGFPGGANPYNPVGGQVPYLPQAVILVPVQTMGMPIGGSIYNPGWGQVPYMPQTLILVPIQSMGIPMGANPYNPGGGQFAYIPQTPQVWSMPPTQTPVGFNSYNPGAGQFYSFPQNQAPLPPSVNPNSPSFNGYNPGVGQFYSFPQNQAPLPAPVNVNSQSFNGYNPGVGQFSYLPQNQIPLPAPVNSNPQSFNGYNPGVGQFSYLPQNQVPLPAPINPNSPSFNGYNPGVGQFYSFPQNQVPLPAPINPNPQSFNAYNPSGGQFYSLPQTQAALPPTVNPNSNGLNGNNSLAQSPFVSPNPVVVPGTPNPNLLPPVATPQFDPTQPNQPASSLLRSTALRDPSLQFQGTYVVQGDSSVARARLAGVYPLTPRALFAATLDLTSEDSGLADSPNQGLNINELYFATAPFTDLPNLRFVIGQLDLTSYFDRNSFAKDGVTHFFNPVFQTNPALSATGISPRPGFLVNWTLTDNIEAKAAAFSSSASIGDFALDGFAGEIGLRYGNGIIRGTYATDRDGGSETGFNEVFSIPRGDNNFGLEEDDREEAYGLNAEYFIPEWNMGVFGRYGRYINREIDEAATTYSFGVSFLDVFTQNDRLGLGYGQELSNNEGEEDPDVLELFYDFRFLPNLRLGFTLQQRNNFSETDVGVRLKTEFDVIPRGN